MSETVFVLGAGFSSPAKIPTQDKIMLKIAATLKKKTFYENSLKLYKALFNISENKLHKIPLEDVFTFLDRSISNREDTNKLQIATILERQNSLKKLISMILNNKLLGFVNNAAFKSKREIYKSFFEELVEQRRKKQDSDPFAIISLNWDTIPEYFIDYMCVSKQYDDVKIDYTCFDNGYNTSKHIPSIHLKRLGYFNIKLMKLHGSLNWGYCSSCGRLFVQHSSLARPPVFYEMEENVCMKCPQVNLKRLIVTPTFMKDLNNTHLKMVWHNALLDLQEAKRIVFVGYSFPLADYEFRYILTKAIAGSLEPEKKQIRVILYPPNSTIENKPTSKHNKMRWERELTEKRYRDFFGHLGYKKRYKDALDFMKDPSLIWKW